MREESSERKPKLYEIFHGEVASLQTYGAFIKIPQCRKQGLLHKSQMSTARIDDPSEMLSKGEKVYCKIISMMEDGEKISLSMKVVNQTTGQDLDPNNVQSSQDEKKRRQWKFKENNRIELGAELNTTCRRCGGHGHLTMDCFVGKGDNQYGLMPEMNELMEMVASEATTTSVKKKKKKEKKKSKKKKRHTSESEDSEEEHRAKRKSHGKEKRPHKAGHSQRQTGSDTVKHSKQDHSRRRSSSSDSEEELKHKYGKRYGTKTSDVKQQQEYRSERSSHIDKGKSGKASNLDGSKSSKAEHLSKPALHDRKSFQHGRHSSSSESDESASSVTPRTNYKPEGKRKSDAYEKHNHDLKASHGSHSHRKMKRHSSSEEISDSDVGEKRARRRFSHKDEGGRRKRENSLSEERIKKRLKKDDSRKRHHK